MRDAYGGTGMIYLFMVFFIIYVTFIAIALNFAKIYRVKNNVINTLEQAQYSLESGHSNGDVYDSLEDYLNNVPYVFSEENKNLSSDFYKNNCANRAKEGEEIDTELYQKLGVCVVKKGEDNKPYYNVTVYYVFDFPVLNITDLTIASSGETIVLSTE